MHVINPGAPLSFIAMMSSSAAYSEQVRKARKWDDEHNVTGRMLFTAAVFMIHPILGIFSWLKLKNPHWGTADILRRQWLRAMDEFTAQNRPLRDMLAATRPIQKSPSLRSPRPVLAA